MPDPFDLEPGIRDQLQRVGTARLSSQLLKRGLRNVFIPRVAPVNPLRARMVEPAYIPRHLAAEVARDGLEQERLERFVRKRVDRGASIVGLYPPGETAMAAYRRWVDAGEDDGALGDP
jgi:hypothetical protein